MPFGISASTLLRRLKEETERRTPLDEILAAARDVAEDAGRGVSSTYERVDDAAPSLTRAYRAGLRLTPAAPLADLLTPEEERRKRSRKARCSGPSTPTSYRRRSRNWDWWDRERR